MACPISDETCRSCIRCIGGDFIPTRPDQCECDGSGCTTHSKCVHGEPLNDEDGCVACEARRSRGTVAE